MLTDTHAHLFWDSYEKDLDEVIQRSLDSGVNTIINIGTDTTTSKLALEQVEQKLDKMPGFSAYSTIGIHPHEAFKYSSDESPPTGGRSIHKDIERLEQIYRSKTKKVIAVGECGLDYFFVPKYQPPSLSIDQIKDLQQKLLEAQVGLAKKLDLPLTIHCRDAWGDIWEYISEWHGILHCFSGDLAIAQKAIANNFLISFAATLTYPKNDQLREVAKQTPLNKIVLETDCPFLPPQSKRGQRNEPSSILEIAQLIADIKNVSLSEVANQTTANTKAVFKIN